MVSVKAKDLAFRLSSVFGEAGGDDLGHAEEGAVFNALGGADDDLAGVEMGAETSERGTEELGRDNGDDDLRLGDGRFAAGDGNFRGDGKAGQE